MSNESILANPAASMPETAVTTANLGVALGLVLLSGGATALGAAVVYIPSLVNLANNRTLAISLGISAGVMLFVSFIEIFGKAQLSFVEAGFETDKAFALTMATFFAGAVLMLTSHYILEHLLGGHGHDHPHSTPAQVKQEVARKVDERARSMEFDLEEQHTSPASLEGTDTSMGAGNENTIEKHELMDDDSWGQLMLPCCVSAMHWMRS